MTRLARGSRAAVAAACWLSVATAALAQATAAPEFLGRITHWRNGSGTFRMNVALSALPSFTALPGEGDHLTAGIIIGSLASQQLIPRAGKPGRVAALEIMVNTPAVANLIRQGKLDQLENTMQSGAAHGMRTMDSAIQELLDKALITGKDAYKKGINKAKFEPVKDNG